MDIEFRPLLERYLQTPSGRGSQCIISVARRVVKWGGSSHCSPITEEEVREGLKQRSIEPLQPEDIANAVGQPQRVSVNEILIRPTQQTN